MRTKNLQKGSGHLILTGFIVVVIIAALGFVAWKQFYKSDDNSTKTTTASDSRDTSTNTVEHNTPSYNLSFKTPLKTDKQGDCHLSMTNSASKEVLTQDNSTKNKKGETGCEKWKLDTSKLLAGNYKVTVTFNGGGEKLSSTITLPLK